MNGTSTTANTGAPSTGASYRKSVTGAYGSGSYADPMYGQQELYAAQQQAYGAYGNYGGMPTFSTLPGVGAGGMDPSIANAIYQADRSGGLDPFNASARQSVGAIKASSDQAYAIIQQRMENPQAGQDGQAAGTAQGDSSIGVGDVVSATGKGALKSIPTVALGLGIGAAAAVFAPAALPVLAAAGIGLGIYSGVKNLGKIVNGKTKEEKLAGIEGLTQDGVSAFAGGKVGKAFVSKLGTFPSLKKLTGDLFSGNISKADTKDAVSGVTDDMGTWLSHLKTKAAASSSKGSETPSTGATNTPDPSTGAGQASTPSTETASTGATNTPAPSTGAGQASTPSTETATPAASGDAEKTGFFSWLKGVFNKSDSVETSRDEATGVFYGGSSNPLAT
jgi:hypothetical protein